MVSVFDKVRLKPSQARTVADLRYGDAQALQKTGQRERANGVIYLAGIAVECLLKAILLKKHKWLQSRDTAQSLSPRQAELMQLCHKAHDLWAIVERIPEITESSRGSTRPQRDRLVQMLRKVSTWTIHIRYSPKKAHKSEASLFLDQVKELRQWLIQILRRL